MAKSKKDNIDSFSGMFKGTEDSTNNENTTTRGKGRPKETRETKKRVSLVVLPSLYESVGKIAYIDRVSISEIVSKCLEEYVEINKDKIEEYDNMEK